ncbi:hypothetical protein B0H15DRAFT_869255 [Mycena belliarum]|uniref:F-box domain-containing protein n=1 Tax=Mycena belliarum TaxID=1033014 RepID=A0AAD6TQD0_9AGAR|nr:hypothetical protein B0H15DRAFT_869255 [Mycena belliae]
MSYPISTSKAQIRELLRSHAPPPEHLPSLIYTLSGELARYDAQILSYEAEIYCIDELLACAKAERAELKAHGDDIRSLCAPIRRLPSEILVEIFELCRFAFVDATTTDLEDIAMKPLLDLAGVCIRWRDLVLGTPTLWSTLHLHAYDIWDKPTDGPVALQLLELALERSANVPLHLQISTFAEEHENTDLPLKLLAHHAERWKSVYLFCPASDLQYLAPVKGRLHRLEQLELYIVNEPHPLDLFEDVPRLTSFSLAIPVRPPLVYAYLDKLRMFGCVDEKLGQIPSTVALMSRLPRGIHFRFQISLRDTTDDEIRDLTISSTSSDIGRLSMDTTGVADDDYCMHTLSAIFGALTLPHLTALTFAAEEYSKCPIPWPHNAFLSLAARSAFPTHLQSLDLTYVVVTEPQLVEALSALATLQHLAVADHESADDGGAPLLLVSDSLLAQLTLRAAPPRRLVPRLRTLTCITTLQFADGVYLAFARSRGAPPGPGAAPFDIKMYWAEGHYRALDPGVAACLHELCVRREVLSHFAPYTD